MVKVYNGILTTRVLCSWTLNFWSRLTAAGNILGIRMHIMCLTWNPCEHPHYNQSVLLCCWHASSSVCTLLSCHLSSRCQTVNRLMYLSTRSLAICCLLSPESSIAQRPQPQTPSPPSPPSHNDRSRRHRVPRVLLCTTTAVPDAECHVLGSS